MNKTSTNHLLKYIKNLEHINDKKLKFPDGAIVIVYSKSSKELEELETTLNLCAIKTIFTISTETFIHSFIKTSKNFWEYSYEFREK